MPTKLVFILSFYLLAGSSGQALELILKNGDRLNGDLVRQTETHIVLAHPHLGELEIAKDALQALPDSLQVTPTSVPDASTEPDAAPVLSSPDPVQPVEQPQEPEKITAGPKGKGKDDAPNPELSFSSKLFNRLAISRLAKMNAKIGLAYDIQKSRKDLEEMHFFFNSQWNNGKSNYRFNTDYRFGEVNDEISEDRYMADFRFRRNKPSNVFLQSRSLYKADGVREINHHYEQNIGMGYQWFESPRLKLRGGPEVALNYRELDRSNEALGGWAYLGTVFQDMEFQISENYQFEQETRAYFDVEDDENWGYTLDMSLTGNINRLFSLRLGYEYNYDNQVPARVPQEEINFYSSILLTF